MQNTVLQNKGLYTYGVYMCMYTFKLALMTGVFNMVPEGTHQIFLESGLDLLWLLPSRVSDWAVEFSIGVLIKIM